MVRRKRIIVALAAGLLAGIIAGGFADTQRTSLLLRGDFPAFYAAASLVLQGNSAQLYVPEVQQAVQATAWPSLKNHYYFFAYPPTFACLLVPLALLPPVAAKLLWTALMAIALWAAALVLHRFSKRPDAIPIAAGALSPIELSIFALCTPAVYFGVLGGQNAALSVLFYAMVVVYSRSNPLLAGIAVGLWMFKPHFALTVLLCLLLSGRVSAILWSGVVVALLLILATGIFGTGWPSQWVTAVIGFSQPDYRANGHQMISFMGAAASIMQNAPKLLPTAAVAIRAQAVLASGLVLLNTALHFFHARRQAHNPGQWLRAAALLGPTIVLVSPHTLFYDSAMCLVSLALVPATSVRVVVILIGAAVLVGLKLANGVLAFDPLIFAVLLCYCWLSITSRFADPVAGSGAYPAGSGT